MMKHSVLAGIAFIAMAFSACSDDTFDFGNSLTQEADKLSVSKASYAVSTRTVVADSVLLRNSYCNLGRVKDLETGAFITSEFMTQFNILETFSMPENEVIVSRLDDMPIADSCRIEFYLSQSTTTVDTLAAMKIRVSELDVPMEEGIEYYSNFDPVAEGLLRQDGLSKDLMFSYKDLTVAESVRGSSTYYDVVNVRINQPYTDKNGVVYNNYGSYVMQQYYKHPEYFKNSYHFVHNVCPGFFVSVVDGEGIYTEVPNMCLRVYFQAVDDNDSIVNYAIALAGTEEVLQTTKITNERNILDQMAQDNTCTYIKAPAGLYTEVTLPVEEIYNAHENDSLMSAKISFQRINSDYPNSMLQAPSYILMVQKDSLSAFFEKNKKTDNITSFYTSYLSSNGQNATNEYTFSNISSLIRKMSEARQSGMVEDPEWTTKHPDWNKVLLVPIQLKTQTSSSTTTISAMEHSIGVSSTKLVGGSENPYAPINVEVVYGKFNQ